MTKGYILQDVSTHYYVIGSYEGFGCSNFDLTTDILNATTFNESELIFALQKISEDSTSPCYTKQFIQITVWTT